MDVYTRKWDSHHGKLCMESMYLWDHDNHNLCGQSVGSCNRLVSILNVHTNSYTLSRSN